MEILVAARAMCSYDIIPRLHLNAVGVALVSGQTLRPFTLLTARGAREKWILGHEETGICRLLASQPPCGGGRALSRVGTRAELMTQAPPPFRLGGDVFLPFPWKGVGIPQDR